MTDRHQAERQVRRHGRLAALSRTQRAIIHRAERDHLLQEACSACVEAGQACIASAWLRVGRPVAHAGGLAGAGRAAVRPAAGRAGPRCRLERTPSGRALFDGLRISNDLQRDPTAALARPVLELVGVRAQAVLLRCAGEIVGVMLLHMDEPDWFDDDLVELLGQLTTTWLSRSTTCSASALRRELRRQSALDYRRLEEHLQLRRWASP
ncbi:MAG: GAF domain-containing protein [Burkholderiaceae bacterium]